MQYVLALLLHTEQELRRLAGLPESAAAAKFLSDGADAVGEAAKCVTQALAVIEAVVA